MHIWATLASILGTFAVPGACSALILLSTADPNQNTTPPTGALADSGWNTQGLWSGGLGTTIGPHHFITARHLGGTVGDSFILEGIPFTTVRFADDSATDLRIVEVSMPFPCWAQLYRSPSEWGKPVVVFGVGVTRGSEVRVNGVLKGWLWDGNAGVLRWGENVVAGTNDYGAGIGPLLKARFDANAGPNEAQLGAMDSGGGVFIQESGVWKLAAINYAVDGSFNDTTMGPGFSAALFDIGGLYVGYTGHWTFIQDQAYDIPSSFYATRIASRAAWIDSVIAPPPSLETDDVPALSSLALGSLAVALALGGAFQTHRSLRSMPSHNARIP